LSRRHLSLLALAAALAGGAAVPQPAAAGAACVTYDDASGDASLEVVGPVADADQDLDILGLTLDNTATDLVAEIQVAKLAANPAKAPGHGFSFGYTFNERTYEHSYYSYGQAPLNTATQTGGFAWSSYVNDTSRAIPVTAAFDTTRNVVTLSVRLADLEPWAFAPAFGSRLTALWADSSTDYVGSGFTYDDVAAPEGAAYRVRYGCGPDAVDLGDPPAPRLGAAPDVAPRAGCFLGQDATGDGRPTFATGVAAPNEPGLDLVGYSVNTTASEIKAHLHLADLGDKPANFVGDRFEIAFGYEGATYTLAGGRVTAPSDEVTAEQTRGQVNGTTNAALLPTVEFDKDANTVAISVARSVLSGVHGKAIPYGAVFTGVTARTWGIQPALQFPADTATNAADTKYTVGHSPCYTPPPATLAAVGRPSVQYGDAARLTAKLTKDGGGALAGKPVTFTLGSRSATATTNSSGVATALVVNTLPAGDGAFTASFAGDSSAGAAAVTAPVTLRAETTRLTLSVAKSGTKRTVTATLKDDDGKPVAGQTVTWLVNGKAAGSAKTDAKGVAVLKTAKPGQTVVAKYAGLTGRYLAAQASKKA
jgi:hypothetical protein